MISYSQKIVGCERDVWMVLTVSCRNDNHLVIAIADSFFCLLHTRPLQINQPVPWQESNNRHRLGLDWHDSWRDAHILNKNCPPPIIGAFPNPAILESWKGNPYVAFFMHEWQMILTMTLYVHVTAASQEPTVSRWIQEPFPLRDTLLRNYTVGHCWLHVNRQQAVEMIETHW